MRKPREIIPKVSVMVKAETLLGEWNCPGCGDLNQIFLFSETHSQAIKEARSIEQTQCDSCTRKYQTTQA